MPVTVMLPGHEPAPCRSYRHHVTTEVTWRPREADPRVAGRSKHEAFQVTRLPDALSPAFLHACASGTPLGEVVIELSRPGADDDAPPTPYLRFTLSDVIVVSVLESLEDDGPFETVQLDYAAVTWTYLPDDRSVSWRVHGSGA